MESMEDFGEMGMDMEIDLDTLELDLEDDGQQLLQEEEVNDEEGGEEEEEEDDDDDDEEYTLCFQGEMDPLAFAEDDHTGAQPYQQFERLEYEALAARKRKKQHDQPEQMDDNAKKARQQDLFGASIDEIMEAASFGLGRKGRRKEYKKRSRRKGDGPKLSPEVTKKLGDANLLYATSRYDEAIELLKEVIRLAPNVPDAYHTLGLVYDTCHDKTKAINFYMIAAHLTPKDAYLWKRLATWSMEQGNTGQVIYCLTKAMKADPEDARVKWDRASLFVELKDYQKAAEAFDQIVASRSFDVEARKMAAKVLLSQKKNHSVNIMEPALTTNAIPLLLSGSTDIQPLLQIIDIGSITSLKKTSSHFRITLSDGTHQHKTLLPSTYSPQVASEDIQIGSVILLKKAACMVLQNSLSIRVVELEVVMRSAALTKDSSTLLHAKAGTSQMHHKIGQGQLATEGLEKFIAEHPSEADLTVVNLLAALHMENKAYSKAIEQIEHARMIYCSGQGLPLDLAVKAGICRAHIGNVEEAEKFFEDLHTEQAEDFADLISDVADAYMSLGHHQLALKYFFMLEGTVSFENASLWLKIAQCYQAIRGYPDAIKFYYKAINDMADNVDLRLTLASLLVETDKTEEAIELLLPPQQLEESANGTSSTEGCPWWFNGKIKTKLAQIYHSKGMVESFVEAVAPLIRETLFYETLNQKVRIKKKLPKSVLSERVKLLDDNNRVDNVFFGFRPILSSADMSKAARARKILAKMAARKEERKAAALAAGVEWQSDSDEEIPEPVVKETPLPDLLKDEEHYQLLIEVCKGLASLRRYWEALEIINHSLKLGHNHFSPEKQGELRSLGAQIAYNTTDPKYGYDCARYIVQQQPYSIGAWNCYYKVVSRLESRVGKHGKFMLATRAKYPDCVPPMVICGHQFAMISQSQGALREYLEAYKLQPDNPLINLCVGTSFINLALGFRVNNKNQCVLQGFAFLHNYQRLCNSNQESNYNLARAYHHVGLVHLAVIYYEKVLAHCEEDHPIPRLPNEDATFVSEIQPKLVNCGHCDLRKEAAYNLHLIYKTSGAVDLARQILKDYCNT